MLAASTLARRRTLKWRLSHRIFPSLLLPAQICVITSDGRIITGLFVGHDQVQNLILNQAQERVYSEDAPTETVDLGLYVIRGDNVCVVGEYDQNNWKDMAAPPLPPIQHHQNL